MAEKLNNDRLSSSLNHAVVCLQKGGIVAFPTETYYGLAVDPDSIVAVAKLFRVKKREADKPVLLLIESADQLALIAENIPPEFRPLMKKYWPGPLTLVFPAKKNICRLLTNDTGTIGARISSHPIACELVRRFGKPITATSANISGLLPASRASEVVTMFGDSVDYVVDGGQTPAGFCSTVLGLHDGKCVILRRGQIDLTAELRQEDFRLPQSPVEKILLQADEKG